MSAKRNILQKERDRAQVAEFYLQGRPIAEIARTLGLSRHTIYLDIMAVQEQWAQEHPGEYAAKLTAELARIDLIEMQSWESWLASKGEKRKSKSRLAKGPLGEASLAETTQEHHYGDTRYMDKICWCVEQRCRILGFYAPSKSEAKLDQTITYQTEFDREFALLVERLEGRGERPAPRAGEKLPRGFIQPS